MSKRRRKRVKIFIKDLHEVEFFELRWRKTFSVFKSGKKLIVFSPNSIHFFPRVHLDSYALIVFKPGMDENTTNKDISKNNFLKSKISVWGSKPFSIESYFEKKK